MQLLLLLLFSFLLSQDNYKSFKVGLFKGELVNSADNTSISYATIKLFKSSDNSLSKTCSAFSTRPTTSPIPKIRFTILSG